MSGFLDRLDTDQTRTVRTLVESVEFRYDIIGNLPAKLSFKVFLHLEAVELFRVPHVCRSWAKIFASPDLGQILRQQWARHGDRMVPVPERLSTYGVVSLKAQHDLAFRRGNYKSMSLLHWNVPSCIGFDGQGPPNACYSHYHLAWIEPDARRLHVWHLQSGFKQGFRIEPPAHSLWNLAMTESIIVTIVKFTPEWGECLVWKYRENNARQQFPVRSLIQAVTASGNTLALLHADPMPSEDWLLSTTTYTVGDPHLGYFNIMKTSFKVLREKKWKLFIVPGGNSIVFCYISCANEGEGDAEQITFTCFDLRGQTQAQGTLDIRNTEFISHRKFIEDSSAKIDGDVVIMVNVCSRSRKEISYVAYNVALKKLEIHGHSHPGTIQCAKPRDIFLCQDVAYWCEGIQNTDVMTLDIRKRSHWRHQIESYLYKYPDHFIELTQCWLQGDQFFLVRISFSSVIIWSFAKNIDLHIGDSAWALDLQSRLLGPDHEAEMNRRREWYARILHTEAERG